MKIKVVEKEIIKEVDLGEMIKKKNISLLEIERRTGIKQSYLSILKDGRIKKLGNKNWMKIKKALK